MDYENLLANLLSLLYCLEETNEFSTDAGKLRRSRTVDGPGERLQVVPTIVMQMGSRCAGPGGGVATSQIRHRGRGPAKQQDGLISESTESRTSCSVSRKNK